MALALLGAALTPPTGRADPAVDCIEQEFLGLINTYRVANGSGPLTLDSRLNSAADWLSTDMGAKGYFSHTDSLGRTPGPRAAAFGYSGAVGENIAGGLSSAAAVFEAWRNSPGHNSNMLYSGYRVIGIGRVYDSDSPYRTYWTTDFGTVASATPTPPASPGASPTPAQTGCVLPTATPPPLPTPTPPPTPVATPTPVPVIVGDLDCQNGVGSTDALELLRLVAEAREPHQCAASPDIDCDGQVTAADALDILIYVAKLPQSLVDGCVPVGSPS